MGGKTFRRAVRSAEAKVWFEVETAKGDVVKFHCNDSIPGGIILNFAGETTPAEGQTKEQMQQEQGAAAIASARHLFNAAIVADEQELFWAMANGKPGAPGVIDLPMLLAIADMLAEEYSERPTGESSDPGQPRTSSGSPSTAGVSPAVVTYSRSMPVDAST